MTKAPKCLIHSVILNALNYLCYSESDIFFVLFESVRAAAPFFSSRFEKKSKIPTTAFDEKKQSAFELKQEYESAPKKIIHRFLLPSSNPSSYPTREDIDSHFSYSTPPLLSNELLIIFPSFPDTFLITADAFKSATKSALGSDGLLIAIGSRLIHIEIFLSRSLTLS